MKKLVIMLGALALLLALIAVPVAAAEWSNGNWITDDKTNEYYGAADTVYDDQTGVTSKYHPVINTDPDRSTYGWVQFVLRAGGFGASSAGSQIVYVRNTKVKAGFDSRYNPDGTPIDGINPKWEQIPVLADGMSDIKDGLLATGRYEACIADGNSGQPECQEFDIGNAQVNVVPFLGHAASLSVRGNPQSATIDVGLGHGDINVEWIKPVKTGEHPYTPPCYYITVTDTPAWDETVVDSAAWDETVVDVPAYDEVVPAVTHVVHHNAVTHQDYQVGHVHAREVSGSSPHDFHYNGHKYQITGNSHDTAFMVTGDNGVLATLVTIVDTPAYDETVVDVPAHTVHHDAVTHVVHHDATTHIVHHPAVTHQQQVCPPTVMIPEYGFEYFLEIDGYHADISNPNQDPVSVTFSFDLNYFIDRRPWDNVVDDGRIISRTKTVTGQVPYVGSGAMTYHGVITPDVDDAVAVFDWQHGLQYAPSISNAQITQTNWV